MMHPMDVLFARRVIRSAIYLIALAGFLFQVVTVSVQYFSFKTILRTEYQGQRSVRSHDIAACIRYNDLLDLDRLHEETGIHVAKLTANESVQVAMDNEAKLTVKQIFDYTPPGDNVVTSCTYRPDDWDLETGDAGVCGQRFLVTRFFTQERICYHVSETSHTLHDAAFLSLSTYYPSIVFDLEWAAPFAEATVVAVVAFPANSLPLLSRVYASPPLHFPHPERQYNLVSVTPADVTSDLLPAPYDTRCVDIPAERMYECEYECVCRLMEPLGRVPAWHIVLPDDPRTHLRPFSLADVRNSSLMRDVLPRVRGCMTRCHLTPCHLKFTKTTATLSMFRDFPFGVRSMAPRDPHVVTTAEPFMSFISFFTFTCSCFGTWFGVSFLSLDMFARRTRWLRRRPRPPLVAAKPFFVTRAW